MISKDFLISICQFLSEILGPTSEVLLHNAKNGAVEWINEESISHRKIGDINATSILQLLNSKCENNNTNRIVGALNTSESNVLIRTSNLMIRDDEGKLRYVICVNQDITGFVQIQPFLKHMFLDTARKNVDFNDNSNNADIEEIMTNIILEEVKHADVYKIETKAAKMAVLVRLYNRGVFKVKQAIPKVCEVLNIAQPTLYKYLKQIEGMDEEE
ncbi:MAG: PAS domain-containing protein [Pleomorphochaeta sp.]